MPALIDMGPKQVDRLLKEMGRAEPRIMTVLTQYSEWRTNALQVIGSNGTIPELPTDLGEQLAYAEARWRALFPPVSRLRMPWEPLDQLVGPLEGGDVMIVASQTGIGKTTLVLNILQLLGDGERVLVLPTETPAREVIERLAAMDQHFYPDDVVEGNWEKAAHGLDAPTARARYLASLTWLEKHNSRVRIANLEELRATELTRLFDEAKHERRGVVIVDHLLHITHDLPGAKGWQAEADTLRLLKRLALRFDVAVVCTTQVNTREQGRGDPVAALYPPQLHHVFGGQMAGFLSTVVLTAYRPLRDRIVDPETRETEPIGPAHFNAFRQRRLSYDEMVKPGISAFLCVKHRRSRGRLQHSAELHYHGGYLFAEPPILREWDSNSPAARRQDDGEREPQLSAAIDSRMDRA